jgi:pimeloyl-ACP methyl ester carboxylesterase
VLARISLGIAAMMVGLVILGAYVSDHDSERSWVPVATGEKAPSGLARFYDQNLVWAPCDRWQCTWVRVPLDYDEPSGRTIRLRVKLRPADSGKAAGTLFINPGGPGGSGVDFVESFASSASAGLRSKYAILGFDPRGVARSAPLTCLPAADFDDLSKDDPSPELPGEVTALEAGFASIGKACVKHSGALAAHVSTAEAARDLDIMRALMGQNRLDYYGASYGTQLGATYADLFTKRVGKLVLDGGIDMSIGKERQGFGQAQGFDRALRSALHGCVDAGGCPLGDDVETAEGKIVQLLADLDVSPIRGSGSRKLTEWDAVYGMAYALYSPDTWDDLVTGVSRASFGDGSILLTLADRYFGRTGDGSYRDNGSQAVYAIRCLDFPSAPTNQKLRALLPSYEKASPVFGAVMAWTSAECQKWPVRSRTPQRPLRVTGAPPILVIGTTRDPATPFAWSKALEKELGSGILVSRVGDGHTGFGVGNTCVDAVVDRYLLGGGPPSDNVTCADEPS